MIKIVPLLMAGILVLSGFSTVTLYVTEKNDLSSITNQLSSSQSASTTEYDMVIIAPQLFSADLQPLVEHKNRYGIRTVLKTTEKIYEEYDGRDEPEQIKYFIKDAIEKWGIKYVMLVGGLNSYLWAKQRDNQNCGYSDWYVPVRYSNLVEPVNYQYYDPGYITDLYYADIYDDEGNFSSWDSNNNGIFAEWNMRKGTLDKDIINLYPDVCVGRLACRNTCEVETVVDKIIAYESQTYGHDWFNRIVIAGGDGFNDIGTEYNEGEIHCEYILNNYMSEFTPVKLYTSNVPDNPQYTPTPKNVVREVSAGCGFFFVSGHGSPMLVKCGWPGGAPMEKTRTILSVFHLFRLTNEYRLPIALLGGCHNAQFNVTIFTPHFLDAFVLGKTIPECLCWWLVKKEDGGAIASISYTAYGYVSIGESGDKDGNGINDPDFIEEKHGFLFNSFFKAIYDGVEILGEAWKAAISRNLDTFPIWNRWEDVRNIEAWVLLGDPSLKIGGYP